MRPVLVNGELWRVLSVDQRDPGLVDRTGVPRLATADPETRTVRVSSGVRPPLLDRVMVHEMAHAATVSYGLLDALRLGLPPWAWVHAEEWAASLVERHGIEAAALASQALGRPVCVDGRCLYYET